MKAPAFDYKRARTLDEASALLGGNAGSMVIAGGQTLGPMLNLRLTQPTLLVDITRIPGMTTVQETSSEVILGACITHANFEDGRVPDAAGGFLARVAKGIAYRAVRTRGTVGGSIAHADPASDWVSTLIALHAEVDIHGGAGRRTMPLEQFVKGPLSTDLRISELVSAIRVKKDAAGDSFGYAKLCRKTGEFAEAIGVVRRFSNGKKVRLIAGRSDGSPIVIENGADFIADRSIEREQLYPYLIERGLRDDSYSRGIHMAALQRALDESWGV
jgi:aerobic carbon-monoxide dehydrogenase medium subunit